ncbi:hypothetical protein [Vibrio phage LP.1]|nr:hypothetical protein [Vibrio phage LP.1]
MLVKCKHQDVLEEINKRKGDLDISVELWPDLASVAAISVCNQEVVDLVYAALVKTGHISNPADRYSTGVRFNATEPKTAGAYYK